MDTIVSPYLVIVKFTTEDTAQTKHYLSFALDEADAIATWKEAAEDSDDEQIQNYESFNVRMVHTMPVGRVIPEKELHGIVFSL